jgi:hypothetical protein
VFQSTVTRSVLIGLYIAWPLIVGVTCATSRVRRRFVVLSAAGWIGATVIATTARPADRALVIGLVLGVGASLSLWLATRRGVTFTWMQDKTYWPDNDPLPSGEKVAAVLVALMGILGLAVGTLAA